MSIDPWPGSRAMSVAPGAQAVRPLSLQQGRGPCPGRETWHCTAGGCYRRQSGGVCMRCGAQLRQQVRRGRCCGCSRSPLMAAQSMHGGSSRSGRMLVRARCSLPGLISRRACWYSPRGCYLDLQPMALGATAMRSPRAQLSSESFRGALPGMGQGIRGCRGGWASGSARASSSSRRRQIRTSLTLPQSSFRLAGLTL